VKVIGHGVTVTVGVLEGPGVDVIVGVDVVRVPVGVAEAVVTPPGVVVGVGVLTAPVGVLVGVPIPLVAVGVEVCAGAVAVTVGVDVRTAVGVIVGEPATLTPRAVYMSCSPLRVSVQAA
jgi:hypothetical protein